MDVALNKAAPDMWDKVLEAFKQLLERAESSYLKKAKGESPVPYLVTIFHGSPIAFNCTEEENETALGSLRIRAWLVLRAKIDELTADTAILGKLRMHFEERFRYDEHSVPRVWKPDDDIEGAFRKAKDEVCSMPMCCVVWGRLTNMCMCRLCL